MNSIDFNKFSDNIFLTGSLDGSIALWDLRNLKVKLHTFNCHKQSVNEIKWSQNNETLFLSSSQDRTVKIIDINKIGCSQSLVEKEESPVEVLVYSRIN